MAEERGPIERRAAGTVTVRAARLRKRLYDLGWALYGAGMVAFGGGMILSDVLDLPRPFPLWLALPIVVFGFGTYLWPAAIAAGLFAGRKRNLGTATVARDAEGTLRVEAERETLVVPAGAVRQGTVVGGALVLEDARGREISVATGAPDATRLLDELDLEPAARRFTFRWRRLSPRIWSFIGTLFATSCVATAPLMVFGRGPHPSIGLIGIMLASSPWLVAELVSRWFSIRELTVGLDGVSEKSRRGEKTVRFADVERVESAGPELVLVMKDGRRERLFADPEEPGVRAAIEARVREARAIALEQSGAGTAASALLDRAGRSLPEWRAAAAQVLTAATGFRTAAVTAEEIGAVIDDPTAPAEQRLAAAIALGTRDDPASRARIRVAADACASPKLRVALEDLAQGEASDETLEAAVREAARASR